jgi:hypothetical protein
LRGNSKVIYIGCATDDELTDDGKVYDTDRIMFLRNSRHSDIPCA